MPSPRTSFLLPFAASLLFSVCGAAQRTHVVTPTDLADLKRVADPAISPDGRLVAYGVATPQPDGKPPAEHIWLVAADGSAPARPLLFSSGSDASPAFSPDGRTLYFLSDRPNPLAHPGSPYSFTVAPGTGQPDIPKSLEAPGPVTPQPVEAAAVPQAQTPVKPPPAVPDATAPAAPETGMQLWALSLDTPGDAVPLTLLPGGVREFRVSPDGRSVAILRSDIDAPAERARKGKKDDADFIDHDFHFERLWVLDLAAHQARLLTRDSRNIDTVDWSPDGRTLLSRVSPTPRLDDFWRVSQVETFDAATGAQTGTLEQVSGYQEPLYSLDGSRVAYSRFTKLRITDEHFVRVLATGKEMRLEDLLPGTLAEMRWLTGNRLLVSAYVGAHTEANLVESTTGHHTAIPGLTATALDLRPTRDGNTVALLSETPTQPIEVSVWRDGAARLLTGTNPQTAGWALGPQREVTWKGKDGHVVYGVLTLPPGYTAGTRLPTMIHLHGGPEEAFTVAFNMNWYNYGALLASQGYAVLQPNYRDSAGQEIGFTEGAHADLGGKDFSDVMAGLDWMIAQGYTDPMHVGIAGWSFGGFLTSWAVTHTTRFQAGMAGAPITDMISMANTTDIAPSYLQSYLGPFVGHEADYDRQSPIRFAQGCKFPVLFLQGQADVRVPLGQGQELYHALKFQGCETEMVTYPREPHIFAEREHQVDSLTRELAWFAKYLKP